MNVLGIHIGHDSGASLIIDDKIVADVSEERFVRTKHYTGIPSRSVDYCLDEGDISFDELDYIAVPSKISSKLLYLLIESKTRDKKIIKSLERAGKYLFRSQLQLQKPPIYFHQYQLNKKTKIINVEHHLAHAASAYYTSDCNEKQLLVTMDGAGDGFSTCIWRGENGIITPLKKFNLQASLGWFYGNVTEALDWQMNDGEGKTMGLAPYGDYEKTLGVLDGFYPKFRNGELTESHNFGPVYTYNDNGSIHWHLEDSSGIKELVDQYSREDIAAEAQRILEEQTMNIIYPWLEKEDTANLSCAGGIFLNVKLNQRIWNSQKIKNHHIFPNPGDAGLSLGAALYVASTAGKPHIHKVDNIYWGPSFSNEYIENYLRERHIPFLFCPDISKVCAKLLAEDNIVAWFQGRMESGPRALGNRSILMSPVRAENKDIINSKVKFREVFRPFCPSMLFEAQEEFLKNSRIEEFMITSFDVVEEQKDKIPAVVHVDDTMRPQLVDRRINPKYYDLIAEFQKHTGVPVILNTSFNIRGEPIVCTPGDAIKCYFDTGLDYLALGDYLVMKKPEEINCE